MKVTLILLSEPHINTGWAIATAEQLPQDGAIISVFPYVGQKKIGNIRVRDISLPGISRFRQGAFVSRFFKIARLKNSAIKAGDSVWQFGNLSYIQAQLSNIMQKVDDLKIITDSPASESNSDLVQEKLVNSLSC